MLGASWVDEHSIAAPEAQHNQLLHALLLAADRSSVGVLCGFQRLAPAVVTARLEMEHLTAITEPALLRRQRRQAGTVRDVPRELLRPPLAPIPFGAPGRQSSPDSGILGLAAPAHPDGQTEAAGLVDHVQELEPAAVGPGIELEVHSPHLVGMLGSVAPHRAVGGACPLSLPGSGALKPLLPA